MKKNEVIIFSDNGLCLEVNINPDEDTVWLTQEQMSVLFETSRSTIAYHINNVFKENELDRDTSVEIFDRSKKDASRPPMYYNLDVIISVGYRVKSPRGIMFRKWATSTLKDYAIKGYAIDKNKFDSNNYLNILNLLKRSELESDDILKVLEQYTLSLNLLDDYDHNKISKPVGNLSTYVLEYDESKIFIDEMKKQQETALFGLERENTFKSTLGAIYQTINGDDVYPTVEEKAAHLLYFLVKNHGFVDGNKRISAALFVYFLDKNDALIKNGLTVIDNKTLAALTILLAESNPKEKDIMINLIMSFLS